MHNDRALASLLVFFQAVAIAGAIWTGARFPFAEPSRFLLLILGFALAAWASLRLGKSLTPLPLPNGRGLKVVGPYRWVRHPIYLGVLIATGSFTQNLASGVSWVLLVLILAVKIELEEHLLRLRYDGYRAYSQRTWRVIPWIW